MLVRIKEHGVIVLCKKGADGEYLEEGITLEAAFNAHGKWINPMRDAHVAQNLADDASLLTQGVRALDFTGGGLKDAPVRKLAHILKVNTTVTRLNLAWNEIGSKGATYLAESLFRNTSLVHLDLSHNEIQDSGAERLACSLGGDPAALKVHGITGAKQWNQLDPDFIPTGEGNLTLRTLALQCNPIEENGRQALLTAVAYNGGLETLSLGGGTMIGRDSKLLGETFWCNQHITSLDLAHASMQTDAAKELARVIARPHGTLLSLNLSRNELGDEGVKALAQALLPITLTEKEIGELHKGADGNSSQTLITETRVRREERTQIVQPTLTSLDLTDNHIGKQGITEIAVALKHNRSLKLLNLCDNRCEDQGATALANALKYNTCLESLFFYDNTIQLEAVPYVTEMLRGATSLQHTDMVFQVGHLPVQSIHQPGGPRDLAHETRTVAPQLHSAVRASIPDSEEASDLEHKLMVSKCMPRGEAR